MLSLHSVRCEASDALACVSGRQVDLEPGFALPAGQYYLRVDHSSSFSTPVPADFTFTVELLAP